MHTCEDEMIRNAQAGDTHAFRNLVETNQRLIYSMAYRMLHQKEDAEDVVQEAFVRCWKNLHRFDMGMKFSTWLYRITINLCLDVMKSKAHKQRQRVQDLTQADQQMGSATPESILHARELFEQIWKRSAELTPRQKAVFVLRDLEDMSVQEVSEVLSLSPENVKSNLYYARKKMSEWITKMELR